eukprot:1335312-Rhodomonas_salina.1
MTSMCPAEGRAVQNCDSSLNVYKRVPRAPGQSRLPGEGPESYLGGRPLRSGGRGACCAPTRN